MNSRTVDIRLFASLVEHVGSNTLTLEVDPTITVEQLWQRLVHEHPSLGSVSFRPMVAFDLVYSDWDRALDDVREVAFLPPVSGG